MTRERLYLFDTTLRDGAQTQGVDFSRRGQDGRSREMLDALGIDYIEGGCPGANPTDTAFFAEAPPLGHAKLHRLRHDQAAGPLARQRSRACGAARAPRRLRSAWSAKSWDFHVEVALGISLEENLDDDRASRSQADRRERPRGAVRLRAFLRRLQGQSGLRARLRQGRLRGRRALGGAVRHQWRHAAARRSRASSARSAKHIPGDQLGIHAHNDTDNGVANSLAAVRAGARQIQGTLNGLGERCGNANLSSIIPTLMLKPEYAERFETGVTPEKLQNADACLAPARRDAEPRARTGTRPMSARPPSPTKAASMSRRCRRTRAPTSMCRPKRSATGASCSSPTRPAAPTCSPSWTASASPFAKDDPRIARLLDEVKEREASGYAYEAAEASFELLARRDARQGAAIISRSSVSASWSSAATTRSGELVTISEATVKVRSTARP